MANKYPPVPTPDELKADSKKYVLLGAVLVSVLIISALVYILSPILAVAPPPAAAPPLEAAPPVFPVTAPAAPEFVPAEPTGPLTIQGLQTCTDIDENFNCITPTETFTRGQNIRLSYQVTGLDAVVLEAGMSSIDTLHIVFLFPSNFVTLERNLRIFQEDTEVDLPDVPDEMITYIFSLKDPGAMAGGEIFSTEPLEPGIYFVELTLNSGEKTTSQRVRVEVQ